MTDPREDVTLRLSYAYAWVRPFEGFIFICGGPIDARSATPVSARDALLRAIGSSHELKPRVRYAEEFKDWESEGHYKDLLTFEEHLAELSDLVVLILESPGTLAELGLFSASVHFQRKLAVYVSAHHFNQDSFIRRGPIKLLELQNNDAEVFPWLRDAFGRPQLDVDWLQRCGGELLDALEERVPSGGGESRFDQERWLHRALLICNLVWLMSALTITEIAEYLKLFGVVVSDHDLRQALFILERLELISVVARSKSRYYISKGSADFIRWGVRSSDIDLKRFQMDVVRFYERTDKRRFRAIQEVRS